MTQILRLLEANQSYAAARANVQDARPSRHLAVVTCMDARIDVFAVLGLHLGEAHVLRNAGGRLTEDVLRSLALSCHVLGVDTVVVMQHTKCGLEGVTDAELSALTGAQLGFHAIADQVTDLREDIDQLIATPYLSPVKRIAGFVYDVESGEIGDVVRWERPGDEPPYDPSPVGWVRDHVTDIERAGDTAAVGPVILLTMRGAHSGRVRKVPVMRVAHDGSYAAVASNGGSVEHPQWFHNLVSRRTVTVQDGARTGVYNVRVAQGDERALWWDRAVAAYPPYADYQAAATRQIPVVVLEPEG